MKSRPEWAGSQDEWKASYVAFFKDEANRETYFSGYDDYTTKQIQRMTHIEHFTLDVPATAASGKTVAGPVFLWFDYLHRDPLTWRSRTVEVKIDENDEKTES